MYTSTEEKALIQQTQALLQQKNALEKNTIDSLSLIIRYHEWRYYVKNDPVISDFEYDRLFKALEKIEKENPEVIQSDSPTQRVSNSLTKDFPEVEHLVPMLSLDNSYNLEDINDWKKRVTNAAETDDFEITAEPKFDGSGISLIYENDQLVRGVTRGNGLVGEEITTNLRTLKTIPLRAAFSKFGIDKIEIRGEVVIQKEVFKQMNQSRIEEGLPPLANPRNSAAGSLRIQDTREVAKRGLEAFLYHISYAVDMDGKDLLRNQLKTHRSCIELLNQLGFKSPYDLMLVSTYSKNIHDFCQSWEEKRNNYPYEIDGMVIKVNELYIQDIAGSTAHHPRWAIAYKFKAQQATTKLTDVLFNVGRTGAVTPVAKLEPVQIGGVTVSNVSMFNEDFLISKDIRIGDRVVVERAGDVIPYIVKSISEARSGTEQMIPYPTHCPVCNTPLVKPDEEAVWRCNNINGCEAQVLENMIHFVSKNAMDIRGLGEQQIRRFYELNMLKNCTDIYQLNYDQILSLEGFKEKSVENLKQAIEDSKKQPLYRLLFALGIRFVGERTAKTIAQNIQDLEDLNILTEEQLLEMEDIGPKVAHSVLEYVNNSANIELLQQLKMLGLNTKSPEKTVLVDSALSGKTFVITGTFENFSREELKQKVENLGGKVTGSVTKKTDYLLVGKEAGSKLQKAKDLGTVEIVEENGVLKLLN